MSSPSLTGPDFIAFVVEDVEAAGAFWRDVVGLEPAAHALTHEIIPDGAWLLVDGESPRAARWTLALAVLFGATLADASPEQEEALASYGRAVGLAFQIVDDVLDLTANEEVLGKPVASDLREGKTTLPVIHSLEHGTAADREVIHRVLEDVGFLRSTREQVQEILHRNGSVEYAMAAADRYAEQAREALAPIEDSEFKRALLWVPDFVVARDK